MSWQQRISIDSLKTGTTIVSSYQVKAKYLRDFKGKPGQFLTMVLTDKTGQIVAKMWDNAAAAAGRCSTGDIIEIKGNVTEFNGIPEIHLTSFRALSDADFDPREYIPSCPKEPGEMLLQIDQLRSEIENPFLAELLRHFFDDSTRLQLFMTAPAAKLNHQAYLGGLLEHTLNVAMLAREAATLYPQVDKDLLLTGAIIHDLGKMDAYQYSRSIDFSAQGRLLGHIVLGLLMIDQEIKAIPGFPDNLRLKLLHIITSHHGRYEWQSPERPQFLEAAIIHHLDLMEANIDMFTEARAKAKNEGLEWMYNKTLEQYVWSPSETTSETTDEE